MTASLRAHACRRAAHTLSLCVLIPLVVRSALGQAPEPPAAAPEDSNHEELVLRQGQLTDNLKRLEGMMLKMAEYEAAENPQRAALLREALAQSRNRHVSDQMESLVELLTQQRYQQAVENQELVVGELQRLLELLLREERADHLKNEQERLRNYLEQIDRLLRQQRSLRARTAGGDPLAPLSDQQKELAEKTGELNAQIDQNERSGAPGQAAPDGADDAGQGDRPGPTPHRSDDQPGQAPGAEGDSQSGAPDQAAPKGEDGGERPGQDGQPPADPSAESPAPTPGSSPSAPSDSAPDSASPSSPGTPSEAPGQPPSPSPGQPGAEGPGQPAPSGQGAPSPGGQGAPQETPSSQQPPFPGRDQLGEAQKRMEQAQERLEEAERNGAAEEQAEALRLLQQAKAELEEILRQLREEEIERTLAMLESRFRRMLQMQIQVNEDTQQLDQVAADARDRQFAVRTNQVSVAQRAIAIEADKALMLLKEEGSSVAFPEAVQEIRDDMDLAATWLGDQKVGEVTQVLQDGIVEALEEMLAALQQAQQDASKRKENPPPSPGGDPGEQPLVDLIAELKMIRTLQVRINRRTDQLSQLLGGGEDPIGQAVDEDIQSNLRGLAERELRVQQITRDIVVGRNE